MPQRAIVFVDVTDSMVFFDRVGQEDAVKAMLSFQQDLKVRSEIMNGRVVKTLGDGALLAFDTADDAVRFCLKIVHEKRPGAAADMGVRAGLCVGEVQEVEGDVWGDPVNVAARLLDLGTAKQVLTIQESMQYVTDDGSFRTRRFRTRQLKGRKESVDVVEIMPPDDEATAGMTRASLSMFRPTANELKMKIRFGEMVHEMGTDQMADPVTVGRSDANTIVIRRPDISRRHLEIRTRDGKFFLKDHSSNGTILQPNEGASVNVEKEEILLHGSGKIMPGVPEMSSDEDPIEFEIVQT